MPRRPSAAAIALLAASVISLGCVSPQTPPAVDPAPAVAALAETGAFIITLGADTVGVERFTRTATSVEGALVVRTPATRVVNFSATLAPGGTVAAFETSSRPGTAMQGPPTQQFSITFVGDSARITAASGQNAGTRTIAAQRGAIPSVGVMYSMLEQGALQHRRSGADSTENVLLNVGGQTIPVAYANRGADSLYVYVRGTPLLASVDRQGRFLGLDGIRTTAKVLVRRVGPVDFERIVASFASRDQAGQALAQLSPRDTVTATVGSATVTVNYSRPSRRGRQIFGSVVPWNQVWRTGANAATSLTTSADLTIGGVPVPAGSYTLFTLPTQGGTKLIINSQTGQWGTAYDPARDFARVDMTTETLPAPVEQFTIDIVPSGAGAQLQLSWDRTRFSVPIAAK